PRRNIWSGKSFSISPRSGIRAGDLRSRSLHADLHVELHYVENSRPADSAPYFARLARFSFNWRDPLSKMSKVVAPRDTRPDSARELTNSNPFFTRSSKRKKPQNVLHQTHQTQNKPGSEIGISDSRSRVFHEEPYA